MQHNILSLAFSIDNLFAPASLLLETIFLKDAQYLICFSTPY